MCCVPEVKVKIGHRFLLSLQGYISNLVPFSVERGTNAATQDQCGPTALHDVSYNGHLDIARFVLGSILRSTTVILSLRS